MIDPSHSPYRSAAVRDEFYAYYDSLAARQWPVASQERMIPTSYGQTFARITGPAGAPPLVLLPGAVTTSLMWAPNIRALSESHRTYAFDQIGDLGRTTCTRPVRRFTDLFGWLNESFDGLGLGGGINLMGMSFGGGLAAQYTLHYPERVAKAVLLGPAATVLRLSTKFMFRLTVAAVASKRCLPPLIHWMFADMARKDPAWAEMTIEGLFRGMRSLQPRMLPIPPVLTDAEWAGLRVPVLFLAGENETIYSAEKAVSRLRRVAPQVEAEIVPAAGHDLVFAQAELVNRRVLEFLNEAGAEEGRSRTEGSSSLVPCLNAPRRDAEV